jgi:hypothetical protein
MDISQAAILTITIVFTDVEIAVTSAPCAVVQPVNIVSTVTNVCTWSARTLTYTGNKIGTGVWTAASSMSFEFDLSG